MTSTINITLNVPDFYQKEELTRQLTEYGERLIELRISSMNLHRPSSSFLKGFTLSDGMTSDQLISDFLKEKYGV